MTAQTFTKSVHDIGRGCYAYLQPDGGWGYSNAGLITYEDGALLVDTLSDLPSTREMLAAFRRTTAASKEIRMVLNTHAHPDHTGGNAAVERAEIIASQETAAEMVAINTGIMRRLVTHWQEYGEAGAFMYDVMVSRFALQNVPFVPPTRKFDEELTLQLGSREVRLLKVGPAHTRGDTLAYLPAERIVFTGDIVFHKVHPVLGQGSSSAWIAACDRILSWDVDVVVPGHGPVTDKSGVRALRDYFMYLRAEARKRFDAGMSFEDAARDIGLDAYVDWVDDERIYSNVNALYREFGAEPASLLDVLAMARRHRLAKVRGTSGATRS